MNDNPDLTKFTSEAHMQTLVELTKSEGKGVFSMDKLQDTKNMNEPILPEGYESVHTKWSTSMDELNGMLRRNENTAVGNVASSTSISSYNNDLMNERKIPTQDSCADDPAGQGNYLMSETMWNPPTHLGQTHANGLLPSTVLPAANNPSSSPSRTLQAGTTDNHNQAGFLQSNRTYVVPTDLDVKCVRGGDGNHHPGNQDNLELISDNHQSYKATKKAEKKSLSQMIVDTIHAFKGRFLTRYVASFIWAREALCGVLNKTVAGKRKNQALGNDNASENRKRKREKSTVFSQMKKSKI